MAAGATVEMAAGASASDAVDLSHTRVITMRELIERPEVRAYLGRHNLSRASPEADLMDHLPSRLEFQTWPERVTGAIGDGAADGVVAVNVKLERSGVWLASWLAVATYAGELLHFSPTFTAGGARVFNAQLNSCALKPWRGGAGCCSR